MRITILVVGVSELNDVDVINLDSNQKMKFSERVANAISSLDNECLKMRDQAKLMISQGDLVSANLVDNNKTKYYRLLHHTYRYLYNIGLLKVNGFYIQKFISSKNNKVIIQHLYEIEFNDNKYFTIINLKNRKNKNKNCLGNINGLFKVREKQMFSIGEAVEILTELTRCQYNEATNRYRTPKHLYRALIKYYRKK